MSKFRAKARAIDLLGKGQIADLPTAITELWKNGYDAYADNIQCNLYRGGYKNLKNIIFTVTDDGMGMTREDLEERWIVLGTDSKTRRKPLDIEFSSSKKKRAIMGEKGIGRLSVSYLGNQMFLISKKKNEKCVCLFMDWRILENFNLFLDDIDIDIYDIESADNLFDNYKKIIENFKRNLNTGDWSEHEELRENILNELNNISLTKEFVNDSIKNIEENDEHGTTFIIVNPYEQILDFSYSAMELNKYQYNDNYLRGSLIGFYNSFKKEKPDFNVNFYIHDENGRYDLIDNTDFFSYEDVFGADHWINGVFDEQGFFSGEVKVYNKITKHSFRPTRSPGKTPYGPFEICFGFLEGEKKKSILVEEKWEEYQKKLNNYGGLYIYRDGIRVLPYGRQETDFLNFEKRRTLRAGQYFFSYRRMAGYIAISRDKNFNLIDKAGREGFIANNAYKELVSNLIEFFIDLAERYFASNENDITMRQEQLEDVISKNEKILEAEKKRNKMTLASFKSELKNNHSKVNMIIDELYCLRDKLDKACNEKEIIYNNVNLLSAELENKKIQLKKLKISKPKRGKLTGIQERKYFEYNEKIEEANNIIKGNNELIAKIQPKLSEENLYKEFENRYTQYKKDIRNSLNMYTNRYTDASLYLGSQFQNEKKNLESIFIDRTKNLVGENLNKIVIQNNIKKLMDIHEQTKEEIDNRIEPFIKHLEQLDFDIDEELLVGWYKQEYDKLKSKIDELHELSQLGLTIEIIDHEFNVLYAQMSESIKIIGEFSKKNETIRDTHNQLKIAFQHLETNHKLLTPLYKTTRRMKTEISGERIAEYIESFFKKAFEKEKITFKITESFKYYKFYTFESIINPVFINIINNAIYWLTPVENRNILIDYIDDKILIIDSGTPIHPLDIEKIFELFVTKKPGGRGIGLYLAKTNLRTIGYDIYATNDRKYNKLNGACFVISELGGEYNG
ncbi:ATP-binding protein [Candidatus Clostridium helianthi]|uniref:ATP-binding protein n=1 Tax=Candidatus Clostridium helianthi TaxID=3381660 RepID=A0ABW8S3F2_9CLOT